MARSDQEDVYIVERIENKKIRNGISYYLIKWEGYEEKTWEPEANIIDSQLIDEFNAKFDTKKGASLSESPKALQKTPKSADKSATKKLSKLVIDENEDLNGSSSTPSQTKQHAAKEMIVLSSEEAKVSKNGISSAAPSVVEKETNDLTLDADESVYESTDSLTESEPEVYDKQTLHNWKCDVCLKMKPKPNACNYCTATIHIPCAKEVCKDFSLKKGIFCVSCCKRAPVCVTCGEGPKSNDYFFRCTRCNICIHMNCEKETERFNRDDFYCFFCSKYNANVQYIISSRRKQSDTTASNRMLIDDEAEELDDERGTSADFEYYIKFEDRSYRACKWVPGEWLAKVAKSKLRNFSKLAFSPSVEDSILPDFLKIDRILAYKSHQVPCAEGKDESPKYEMKAYIKWCGLPYSYCCWEREADLIEYDADEFNSKLAAYKKSLVIFKGWNPIVPTAASFQEFKETPAFLPKQLLPHQLEGINWISYKWILKQNVMLADEMGLGKTIQTIGFLMNLYKTFKTFPFLIVCPTSVCLNWQEEFELWAPELATVVYNGTQDEREIIAEYELFNQFIPKGSSKFPRPIKSHAVIVSYHILSRDRQVFSKIPWEVVIVDEAHRLKGTSNELSSILENIAAKFKLVLTGTPLQNNLRELFNVLRYIAPEKFKNGAFLEEYYSDMQENPAKVLELHELLRPYMLRRTKADVQEYYSIPPKAEVVLPVTMTAFQAGIYKLLFEKNKNVLVTKLGATVKRLNFENLLMELRKCANHPLLCTTRNIKEIENEQEWKIEDIINASGKLTVLVKLVEKLLEKGHRILIFCGMVKMLDIIEQVLRSSDRTVLRIDGGTSANERQNLVNLFNSTSNQKHNIFLLSTRAGGLGINLQSADSVIMYDADWNPHQDLQAHSRAHRFGQSKPVVIYKLLTLNSVEEKVAQIANKKLFLDHVVVERMKEKPATNGEEINLFEVLACGVAKLFDNEQSSFSFDDEMLDELTNFDQIITKYESSTSPDSSKGLSNVGIFKEGFKFAKIWEFGSTSITAESQATDNQPASPEYKQPADEDYFWNKIFKPGLETEEPEEELGIGKRKRKAIVDDLEPSIAKLLEPQDQANEKAAKPGKRQKKEDEIYQESIQSAEDSITSCEDSPIKANNQPSRPSGQQFVQKLHDSHQISYPPFNFPISVIDITVHKFDIQKIIMESTNIKQSKQLILQSLHSQRIVTKEEASYSSQLGFCWFVVTRVLYFDVDGYICLRFNVEHRLWMFIFVDARDAPALNGILLAELVHYEALRSRMLSLSRNKSGTLVDPLLADRPLSRQSPKSAHVGSEAAVSKQSTNFTPSQPVESIPSSAATMENFLQQFKRDQTKSFKFVELRPDAEKDEPDTLSISISSSSKLDRHSTGSTFSVKELEYSSDVEMMPAKNESVEKVAIEKKEPAKAINIESVTGPASKTEVEKSKMVNGKSTSEKKESAPDQSLQSKAISASVQSAAPEKAMPSGLKEAKPEELPKKVEKRGRKKKVASVSSMPVESARADILLDTTSLPLDTLNLFSVPQIIQHLEARLSSLKMSLSSVSSSTNESIVMENELLRQRNKSLTKFLAREQRKQSLSQQFQSNPNDQLTVRRQCEWQGCAKHFNTREAILEHLKEHF